MSVRVYLAAGPEGVERLRTEGALEARAFAVTSALRTAAPDADEEDLEYEVARIAEDVLRARDEVVVVVAADVADRDVTWPADGVEIALGPVPRSGVVALHVAERGSGPDDELLWYDASELDEVAAYLA